MNKTDPSLALADGMRLLPPLLLYNAYRDRPALPSHAATWQDACEQVHDHHAVDVAGTAGWPDRWTVTYLDRSVEQTETARAVTAGDLLLGDPMRTFTWHIASRARAGLHYLTSTGRLHPHESMFERDLLIALDFDGRLRSLASQPFTLTWDDGSEQVVRHTPDFIAEIDDQVWVINVRPAALMNLRLLRNAAALHALCRLHGWQEAVVTGYPRPAHTVLSTIAAARQTEDPYNLAGRMLGVLAAHGPAAFGDLVAATDLPVVARAVLQQATWHRTVTVDLNRLLNDDTLVALPGTQP